MLDFSDTMTQLSAGGTVVVALLALALLQPPAAGWARWLQRKNYQYEVTFSLYMLTPTEKFVFNSVLFLTFSLFTLACVVYLPDHIITVSHRAYYYFAGESALARATAAAAVAKVDTAALAATPTAAAANATEFVKSVATSGTAVAAAAYHAAADALTASSD